MTAKKLTLEDLRDRALAADEEQYKEIHSDALGGVIVARRLPTRRIMEIIDETDETMTSQFEANLRVIYESCSIFHDEQLRKQLEAAEPYDVVERLLGGNIHAVALVANEIIDMYGLQEDMVEELKN
mgnify:CR=1 FL=1